MLLRPVLLLLLAKGPAIESPCGRRVFGVHLFRVPAQRTAAAATTIIVHEFRGGAGIASRQEEFPRARADKDAGPFEQVGIDGIVPSVEICIGYDFFKLLGVEDMQFRFWNSFVQWIGCECIVASRQK